MTRPGPTLLSADRPTAVDLVRTVIAPLSPVSLDTVVSTADLQTRVDRKYVLPPEVFTALVTQIADGAWALEIDGARDFAYESVYFDSPDRLSYLAAAHSRRRRFKIRRRTYTGSQECTLEIKTTGGRGETIKGRWAYDPQHREVLTPDAMALIDEVLVRPGLSATLAPVLTTTYRRSTVLGQDLGFRLTADVDLHCASPSGASIGIGGDVLVETKARSAPSCPDRLLWVMGHRPVRISKYCVGMAALHPELPANKWHRTLRRHLATG